MRIRSKTKSYLEKKNQSNEKTGAATAHGLKCISSNWSTVLSPHASCVVSNLATVAVVTQPLIQLKHENIKIDFDVKNYEAKCV